MSRRLKSIMGRWGAGRRRKPSAHDGEHPVLWLALALSCALVGAAVSLVIGADDAPEVAIATEVPTLVDTWLAPGP